MKKIVVFFLSLIVVFSLAGCSLLGETAEQTIEEFCLENPDDETCLIINEPKINSVFLKMYDDYLNNSSTFCDLYLESESEVYTSCLSLYNSILPLDLLDYTITSVDQAVNENSTEYILDFENETSNKKVSITIVISFVDDILKVSALSSKTLVLDESIDTQLKSEIEEIVLRDIGLLIKDTNYCALIFSELTNAECLEEVQQLNYNSAVFDIYSHTIAEDGSHLLTINSLTGIGGVTYHYTNIKVYATYIDDELVITYGKDYDDYVHDVNERKIKDFLEDITLREITLEEINNNYNIEDDTDILEIINSFSNYHNYEVKAIANNDDTYAVTIHKTYQDVILTIQYDYDFALNMHYITIVTIESTPVINIDFNDVIGDFVLQFNEAEETIDEMDTLFVGTMNFMIAENYGAVEGYITEYELYVDGDQQMLYISFPNIGYICSIDFVLQDNGRYKIDLRIETVLEYKIGEDVNEDFEIFFEEILTDVEGTCNLYFDDETAPYCIDFFTSYEPIGTPNVWIDINYENPYIIMSFYYTHASLSCNLFQVDFTINQGIDDELKYTFVNSSYEEIEINYFLSEFENAIGDLTMSRETLFDEFIERNNTSFGSFVDYVRDNEYEVRLIEQNIKEGNSFVLFDVLDSRGVAINTILLELEFARERNDGVTSHKIITNNLVYISTDVSYDEVVAYVSNVVTDMNSSGLEGKSFCSAYGDFVDSCELEMKNSYDKSGIIELKDIDLLQDRYGYHVTLFKQYEDTHNGFNLFDSDILFYKVDGNITYKTLYYSDAILCGEREVFVAEETREELLQFLNDVMDVEIPYEVLKVKYTDMHGLFYTSNQRTVFFDFVSVVHNKIIKETDDYITDSYIFTDGDGFETEVIYKLVKVYTNEGMTFSINKIGEADELASFTPEEIIDCLNGNSILDIRLQFYEVGTTNDLRTYLANNNYKVELQSSDEHYMYLSVIDEHGDVLYNVTYRYYVELTPLNQYMIRSVVVGGSSLYHSNLDSYLKSYRTDIRLGVKTLDDLNADTNCFSVFTEEYDKITLSSIKLYDFEDIGYKDVYTVSIIFNVDGHYYSTLYELSSVTENENTIYVWELLGYYGSVPDGPSVSSKEATVVINNYFEEYYDLDNSNEYISNTYFDGQLIPTSTVNWDRSNRFISIYNTISISVTDVRPVVNDNVVTSFTARLTIEIDGVSSESDFTFNVIDLGNGYYYLIL